MKIQDQNTSVDEKYLARLIDNYRKGYNNTDTVCLVGSPYKKCFDKLDQIVSVLKEISEVDWQIFRVRAHENKDNDINNIVFSILQQLRKKKLGLFRIYLALIQPKEKLSAAIAFLFAMSSILCIDVISNSDSIFSYKAWLYSFQKNYISNVLYPLVFSLFSNLIAFQFPIIKKCKKDNVSFIDQKLKLLSALDNEKLQKLLKDQLKENAPILIVIDDVDCMDDKEKKTLIDFRKGLIQYKAVILYMSTVQGLYLHTYDNTLSTRFFKILLQENEKHEFDRSNEKVKERSEILKGLQSRYGVDGWNAFTFFAFLAENECYNHFFKNKESIIKYIRENLCLFNTSCNIFNYKELRKDDLQDIANALNSDEFSRLFVIDELKHVCIPSFVRDLLHKYISNETAFIFQSVWLSILMDNKKWTGHFLDSLTKALNNLHATLASHKLSLPEKFVESISNFYVNPILYDKRELCISCDLLCLGLNNKVKNVIQYTMFNHLLYSNMSESNTLSWIFDSKINLSENKTFKLLKMINNNEMPLRSYKDYEYLSDVDESIHAALSNANLYFDYFIRAIIRKFNGDIYYEDVDQELDKIFFNEFVKNDIQITFNSSTMSLLPIISALSRLRYQKSFIFLVRKFVDVLHESISSEVAWQKIWSEILVSVLLVECLIYLRRDNTKLRTLNTSFYSTVNSKSNDEIVELLNTLLGFHGNEEQIDLGKNIPVNILKSIETKMSHLNFMLSLCDLNCWASFLMMYKAKFILNFKKFDDCDKTEKEEVQMSLREHSLSSSNLFCPFVIENYMDLISLELNVSYSSAARYLEVIIGLCKKHATSRHDYISLVHESTNILQLANSKKYLKDAHKILYLHYIYKEKGCDYSNEEEVLELVDLETVLAQQSHALSYSFGKKLIEKAEKKIDSMPFPSEQENHYLYYLAMQIDIIRSKSNILGDNGQTIRKIENLINEEGIILLPSHNKITAVASYFWLKHDVINPSVYGLISEVENLKDPYEGKELGVLVQNLLADHNNTHLNEDTYRDFLIRMMFFLTEANYIAFDPQELLHICSKFIYHIGSVNEEFDMKINQFWEYNNKRQKIINARNNLPQWMRENKFSKIASAFFDTFKDVYVNTIPGSIRDALSCKTLNDRAERLFELFKENNQNGLNDKWHQMYIIYNLEIIYRKTEDAERLKKCQKLWQAITISCVESLYDKFYPKAKEKSLIEFLGNIKDGINEQKTHYN